MAKILGWFNGNVPENIEIRQVYGVVFTKDGRTLLRSYEENGKRKYSLAGGTPENYDKDKEATLHREMFEEVNTTISNPIVIGYQLIDEEDGTPVYAQLRMVAMIDTIGEKRADPDTGETYDRVLTTPDKAIRLLNWGNIGKQMIEEAVRVVKLQLGLNTFIDNDEIL